MVQEGEREMKIKIKYVTKKEIYPLFSNSDKKKKVIFIRKDLSNISKRFLEVYELNYMRSKCKSWFCKLITSGIKSFFKRPLGAIWTLILSLKPYRIKFYIQKAIKGD